MRGQDIFSKNDVIFDKENPFEKEKNGHRKQTKFTEGTYMRSLFSYFLLNFFFEGEHENGLQLASFYARFPCWLYVLDFVFFLQHFDGREASLFFEGLKNNLEKYGCGLIFEVRMLCL